MVPRIDMVALEVETDFAAALAVINEAGHSRIPVYEGNIDRILGFLYARSAPLLPGRGPPTSRSGHCCGGLFCPCHQEARALFSEMQKQRAHVALVVDEYGGTAGLITIEDILEEIVGDIRDGMMPTSSGTYSRSPGRATC
ncbi:MAG: CBS domain-containing protein [Caldilineaceae bacterium]